MKFPAAVLQLVIEASQEMSFEIPQAVERCLYVVSGSATIGNTVLGEARMAVLAPGRTSVSLAAGTRIMIAGGDPLDGPRLLEWNFVSSSKDRMEKAKADWRASIAAGFSGSWFTQPPGETRYIPLPGDEEPIPLESLALNRNFGAVDL